MLHYITSAVRRRGCSVNETRFEAIHAITLLRYHATYVDSICIIYNRGSIIRVPGRR